MLAGGETCSGVTLVRNAMLARCLSDTLPMVGAPGGEIAFGVDVRQWVGSPVTEATASSRTQELAIVFARDPRLDAGSISVQVAAARAGSRYAFTIAVDARTATALPVSLVMGVTAATVEVIARQGAS